MSQFFRFLKVRTFFLFVVTFLLLFPCSLIFSLDLSTGAGIRITSYFESLTISVTGYMVILILKASLAAVLPCSDVSFHGFGCEGSFTIGYIIK